MAFPGTVPVALPMALPMAMTVAMAVRVCARRGRRQDEEGAHHYRGGDHRCAADAEPALQHCGPC
jgi:hypothetical protein